MQRELFEIVERFVVLNDTAYRMLVADGSPAEKLAINRLGLSQNEVVAQAVARPAADDRSRCVSASPAVCIQPKALVQIARAVRRDSARRRLPARHPRAACSTPRAARSTPICAASPATIRAIHFEPAVAVQRDPGGAGRARCAAVAVALVRKRPDDRARSDGRRHADHRQPGRQSRRADRGRRQRPAGRRRQRRRSCRRRLLEAATSPATTIDVWRRALPPVRTMDDIARDYLAMYAA